MAASRRGLVEIITASLVGVVTAVAVMVATRACAQVAAAEEQAIVEALDLGFRKNRELRVRMAAGRFTNDNSHCRGWGSAHEPGLDEKQNLGQLRSYVQLCAGPPWSNMAIFLHVFDRAETARRAMRERGTPCYRLAGERYVIFLRGPCQEKLGVRFLDVLESEVNTVVHGGGSPPRAPEAAAGPPPRQPSDRTRASSTAVVKPPPDLADLPIDDIADAIPELTPAEIATVAGVAGGAALLGSLMLLGASGVRRDEVLESIHDLLRGRLPDDPFEAWKRKYEALGWTYSQKNGIATFDPVDGARNEAGEVFSSVTGRFEPAGGSPASAAPAPPSIPRDGDVNARGEVWSDYSRGWVGRKTYAQDRAAQAFLADKARRDLADMQRPDADIADLHRKIAATRREGEGMRTFFDARQTLSDALEEQRQREFADGPLGATRAGLFDDLEKRLDAMATRRDFRAGLNDMVPFADLIGRQMRETWRPTYTYQDAALDTALQTGALALDAVATKGLASSAVGSGLVMRDAARAGADASGVLLAGAKAAVVDYLFGKVVHVGGGYAADAWTAYGKDAWRALRVAAGGLADDAASALSGFRRSTVAGDLVEQAKRNLDALEAGVHRESSGRMRASLTDVLEVQKNPHQVRMLKQQGSLQTQEAFNHTLRNEVYKPHDQMLLERLRQSSPDLADKKIVVHEFRTPGKSANPINTDRDFRVLMQNADGKWIEVPKAKWERHSNEVFSELTFFAPSKCPKGMSPAQQKAWWAEQHGHTPTDRAFREASRDYSDQAIDALGRRTQVDKPRVAELKDIASGKTAAPAQPVKLADPQAFGQQFHEKVAGNLRRGDPFEAIAQAQKGVDTLDTVRKAYDAQGLASGDIPANLRCAMDAIRDSKLPARPDAAALAALEDTLQSHGFRSLDDFSHKLSSQFEALKWAK